MVKDAEAHAAEDKKRRALVEAKNQGDALIHSTEKAVSEHGDKVGQSVADENRPEKVFRLLQVTVQYSGARFSRPHPLADTQPAQGKHAGLHPRHEKGERH